MDKTKAGGTPIALRVLKELVLPLAGGVAYGAIVAQAKQMPLDGVTAGGVAFFCILAAQGLVLRAARSASAHTSPPTATAIPAPVAEPARLPAPEKKPDEEQNGEPDRGPAAAVAKELEKAPEKAPQPAPVLILEPSFEPVAAPASMTVVELALAPPATPRPATDVVSIRVGVEELKELGVWPEPVEEKPDDGQRPLFRNLAHSPSKRTPVEALAPKQLLDLKMPYQAVLNAAVNFEREIKRHAGMEDNRTLPLESLFEQERFNLSAEQLKQLDTLRRIRNNILHGFETLVDPVEAAALVAAFDRAASWFDPANIEPVEPAKVEVETPSENEVERPAEDDPGKVGKAEDEQANEEAKAPVEAEAEKPAESEAVKAEVEAPADEDAKDRVEDKTEQPEKDEPEKKVEVTKS